MRGEEERHLRRSADGTSRREELLHEDEEVGLVRGQREHTQVGVESVDNVALRGGVVGLGSLRADEFHDLVFALAGNVAVAHDHIEIV